VLLIRLAILWVVAVALLEVYNAENRVDVAVRR
jgi:hypothetical protein